MNSLVSIITPSYNTEEFIEETITSVLDQSYQNWELIIVDDCSSDMSIDIIKKYQLVDSRIKFSLNESNSGPAITRNKAIEMAVGRYIAFLDSDDLWTPEKLEKQIRFMEQNQFPFVYSYYSQIDENGEFIKNIDDISLKVSYYSTLKSNKIGCLTVIYDTNYFGKVYMEDILKRQDYTLWLKLLKKVDYAHCFPEIIAKYRIRVNSVSSNKYKLVKFHWYIYKSIEKKNFFQSVYYLTYYIISRFKNN